MTFTDFQILENTMLKPFATLVSCRDTITSECGRGLSLDQCVQECRDDPFCACGYYLEPNDPNEKSYCAPLNSVLLKNMNLMLNIYDSSTDPTKELWKRSAVFFRPDIYPRNPPDETLLMQKDICAIYYHSNANGKNYYLQENLTWLINGEDSAMKVLFIDRFPQFYELANNIQNKSNFVLKIFSQPQVIAIVDNKLAKIPYLSNDPSKNIATMYLGLDDNVEKKQDIIHYSTLTFNSKFQILSDVSPTATYFLGLTSPPKANSNIVVLQNIPLNNEKNNYTGYFQVVRKAVQPNIFKVAEILPARLTFLQNSILPLKQSTNKILIIILVICIILLIIMIYLFYREQ